MQSHVTGIFGITAMRLLVYLIITGELAANNSIDKLLGVVWRPVHFHVFSAL
jgi:hypothetical protein